MTNFKGRRVPLGTLLAVALSATAIFVLPSLANARDDSSGTSSATIKSFDQGTQTLVVALPNGETVTGTVTRRTKIRCEDQSGRRGRHGSDRIRAREAEPGDDHGGHGNEDGDDNGGRGGESGDDNGDGDSSGPGSSGSDSDSHDDNGIGANCTTADLVAGAAVEEIELDFGRTSVRFDEVELDD
jgi:hypothetical protein